MQHARWLVYVALVVGVGCGSKKQPPSGGGSGTAPVAGGATDTGSGAAAGGASSATGELVLAGSLTGAFRWQPDLALETCYWEAEKRGGTVTITLTDGAGVFIALRVQELDDVHEVMLTSGKLSRSLTGASTGVMAGRGSGTTAAIDLALDTTVTAGPETVTIRGKLAVRCGG